MSGFSMIGKSTLISRIQTKSPEPEIEEPKPQPKVKISAAE